MKNKLLPQATELLVALKNTIPAVLLLGPLSLGLAPAAKAQILFSIDEFTTDTLTVTLKAGTLDQTVAVGSQFLALVDANDIGNTSWVIGSTSWYTHTEYGSGGGAFGELTSNTSFTHSHQFVGDAVLFAWENTLATAGDLGSDLTYNFVASGLFMPTNVSTFALFWGDPRSGPSQYQSSGSAVTGGGSAVPEPSSFVLFSGLGCLGYTFVRRRRSPSAVGVIRGDQVKPTFHRRPHRSST